MKASIERNTARDVVRLRVDGSRDLFAAALTVSTSGLVVGEVVVLRSDWEMVGAEIVAIDGGVLHVRLLAPLADDTKQVEIVQLDVWLSHKTKTCACDACARYRRSRGMVAA